MSASRSPSGSGSLYPAGTMSTGCSLPSLTCPPKLGVGKVEGSSDTVSMERSQAGSQWAGGTHAEEVWACKNAAYTRAMKYSKGLVADVVDSSVEFLPRRLMRSSVNHSIKDRKSSFSVMADVGRDTQQQSLAATSCKGTSSTPMSEATFPFLDGGKVQPTDPGHLKAGITYDPQSYGSLLPTTLKVRSVEEAVSGPLMGVAANEMFANRDAKQMLRGILQPVQKTSQFSQYFDRQQFEGKMRQLEESARHFSKCLAQRVSSSTGGGGVMIVVNDSDDGSSDDGGLMGDGVRRRARKPAKMVDEARVAGDAESNARKQRLNALRCTPQNLCSSVALRDALKKSRITVKKARCSAVNVARHSSDLLELLRRRGSRSTGPQEAMVVLPNEEVSWDTGSVSPNKCTQASFASIPDSACGNEGHRTKVVTDQRAVTMLESFLRSGKGLTTHGILPATLYGNHCGPNGGQLISAPESSRLPSMLDTAFSDVFSTGALSPSGQQLAASAECLQQQRKSVHRTKPARRVIPVGYGMSARARQNYEAMVENWEVSEIEQELRNGEALCHARRRLLKLVSERKRLLNASLAHFHHNPQQAVSLQRREIFRMVVEVDAEDRKQACFSFVDLLEQCCRNTLDDAAWSVVSGALKSSRDLIQLSPLRCNPQNFISILNDCLSLQHIRDQRVQDALQWLAKLFGVSQGQFKSALQSLHHNLNKPRDYEARFHEIDSRVCGIAASTERRVRIKLRRCNFQLPRPVGAGSQMNPLVTSNGDGAVGCVLGPNTCVDRPEVSLVFQLGNETAVSSTLSAHRSGTGGSGDVVCEMVDDAPCYVVDFNDEIVQLKPVDTSVVRVSLSCNGNVLCSGFLHLSKCTFHSNRTLSVILRLDNKRIFVADLRINVELVYGRDRRGRGGRR
ncbi:hypothetical protein, conserved [Trypanosoma brucei brucei TREU927]|uniref:Uncharacterized protein n=1 Tax=Trypanosoma brucei brucei (strain 927/4 GUTat10.1) TaxID=185431 RepID=Q582F8_TRYB2|nr:hypothetical protein, conserved [Trypanosoma brucei brucei TREU927]AAX78873.1 hypothetical protein, conserved [Trypanosoma brucei]AAZ12607.1 hypothetical protein, conserved [Trypanosoma brucei brucei TREU927]